MTRALFASVLAALLLAPAARADNDRDHIGRYQLIPDATVANSAGKRQAQAILLDSATGKTWVLSREKGLGAVWVPLEIKAPKGAQTADRSNDGNKSKTEKSYTPEPPKKKKKKKTQRQSIWDYERDP